MIAGLGQLMKALGARATGKKGTDLFSCSAKLKVSVDGGRYAKDGAYCVAELPTSCGAARGKRGLEGKGDRKRGQIYFRGCAWPE